MRGSPPRSTRSSSRPPPCRGSASGSHLAKHPELLEPGWSRPYAKREVKRSLVGLIVYAAGIVDRGRGAAARDRALPGGGRVLRRDLRRLPPAPQVSPVRSLGLRPMLPRDPAEPHRVSSTLELFFDLTFAVAISHRRRAAGTLLIEGVLSAVLAYLMVFFGIWWAWMNFSWFASAFDTDDWLYRVLTILQMAGVLIFAAGVPSRHAGLRLPHRHRRLRAHAPRRGQPVAPRGRATAASTARRPCATPAGVALVQVAWVLRLLAPGRAHRRVGSCCSSSPSSPCPSGRSAPA